MFKLFSAFRRERLWDFNGGIHPPEMKLQSSRAPLRRLALPPVMMIPLQQHLGPEGELLVSPGDHVLKGQPLTRGSGRMLPVHASTSGTITAIAPHVVAHPSGLSELCITLTPDGEDCWCERHPVADFRALTPPELIEIIRQAGIAGLGGAGFPTAPKLAGGQQRITTLIINAAECEPYITADDRLMQEHAAEIITGCEILRHILTPERTLIGIEDNKPEAIAALRQALKGHDAISLRVIPTKYPSGGAKQLTRILTGKEVPFGKHSASIGVLMQNVGTVFAIKRAILDGEPLIERVVTLSGELMKQPGNVWALLGTPVKHLLQAGGFVAEDRTPMVIMGGPLMGFTLSRLDVPVVKITNCLLTPSRTEFSEPEEEQSCIRCGKCADACPAGLLPQQLYWFSRGEEHEKARQHHLFDCIECGACAYVCPSNIPLVQYYRKEKAEIRLLDQDAERAAQAKIRFEARQERLEREKQARELRHKQAAVTVADSDKAIVQAALERVRSQRQTGDANASPVMQPLNAPRDAIHALHSGPANDGDSRKAALAAAIARAKAKKQDAADSVTPSHTADDPRKAAVAAAIARAKAKKATQQEPAPAQDPADDADPRKAAVAAAIARVKAKKAAMSSTEQNEE